MHTTKLIVNQITRQNRRESHPGQAKSFARKHANRQRKRLELTTTAKAKGITVTELVRQRATEKYSWLDDFRDDDRRWKY